jgi:hypothetical protein
MFGINRSTTNPEHQPGCGGREAFDDLSNGKAILHQIAKQKYDIWQNNIAMAESMV